MLRIRVLTPTDPEVVRDFGVTSRVSFGRASDCDLVLEGTYVSRTHGELVREGGDWSVFNHGTRTPLTLVRGDTRVDVPRGMSESIQDGDVLQILHTRLHVELKPDAGTDLGLSFVQMDSNTFNALAQTDVRHIAPLETRVHPGNARLDLLLALARELSACDSLESVLERIAKTVFDAFSQATHFAIHLPGALGGLAPRFVRARDGARTGISLPQSLLQRVQREPTALLLRGSELESGPSSSLMRSGITSSMLVPQRGAHDIVGILQVDKRGPGPGFTPADLELAVVLASCAGAALERARRDSELSRVHESFVDGCLRVLELREPAAAAHARRVAQHVSRVAASLASEPADEKLSDDATRTLQCAALLHDVGLLTGPDSALRADAPRAECSRCVEQAHDALSRIHWPAELAQTPLLVRLHRERLDGSGYPRGLRAEEIPLAARLLAVVDVFDAATFGDREGAATLPPERGAEVLRREARAGRLDATLVESFITSLTRQGEAADTTQS